MLTKAITSDCARCDLMKVNDLSQMICYWGKPKKGKKLIFQKGNKPLFCKLKR